MLKTFEPHIIDQLGGFALLASKTFLRSASGLLRTISPWEILVYNIVILSIGLGGAYVFLFVPAFYTGADMAINILIVTALCLPESITYALLAASMPRSGGDYVYNSRALHPALGFALNLNFVVWLIFFMGWAAQGVSSLGLTTLFSALGTITGNQTYANWAQYFMSPVGAFVVGTVILVVSAAMTIRGTKPYFRMQAFTFIIAMAGIVISLILFGLNNQASYTAHFNSYFGAGAYQNIIQAAEKNGYQPHGFIWPLTMAASVWSFIALGFSWQSASFSGEIKDVRKSQLLGMPGSLIISGIVMALWAYLAVYSMGYDFIGSVTYLGFVAPSSSPIPITPWIGLLTSYLTNNVILVIIIGLSFVFWPLYWVPGNYIFTTRCMLAWSIDRLAPEKLSYVSPKYHSPVVATMINLIGSEIFMAIFLFTPYLTTLGGILGMSLTIFFVAIAGIVFPYRAKRLFDQSPVNYKVAGIPVITITGILTAPFMVYMIYILAVDPLTGAANPTSLGFLLVTWVAGVVLFYINREYRKRKGVIVDLAYKELPVE